MNSKLIRLVLTVASAGLVTLYGCGGGSSNDVANPSGGSPPLVSPPVVSPPVVVLPPPMLSGTVATGAAVEGAVVRITGSAGDNACANATSTGTGTPAELVATSLGVYSCELVDAAAAPYVVVAIDPTGLRPAMVSMVSTRPAQGSSSVANVTPLTNAIAAMLAPNNDPLTLVPQEGDDAATKTQRAANLGTASTRLAAQNAAVVTQLTPLLVTLGIDPATFNPISTPFAPRSTGGATGDSIDKLLDIVKVDYSAGLPAVGTAFTDAVPISLPGASNPRTVSTGSVVTAFSASELDFARTTLQTCFALPPASRVPNGTSTITVGGATRTAVNSPIAPACQGIVIDDAPSAVRGSDTFLTSGSPASVFFRNVLLDPTMTGARFNIVDVMRVFPSADGKDRAVVNIKWTDSLGNPGNFILVAKKYPGSRSNASQWWLYGNQRIINASVQPWNSRTTQTNGGYSGSAISQYRSGLLVFIDRDRNNPNAAGLTSAVVTGPGLPTAGLVMVQPSGLDSNAGMGVWRKDGIPMTGVVSTTNAATGTSSNLYSLQGSAGVVGSAATSLAAFPNAGATCGSSAAGSGICNNSLVHPSDFGLASNAGYIFDVTSIPAWSTYTFALYYNNATLPSTSFTASIVSGIATASAVSTQVWQDIDAATLSLLSPTAVTAGTATSFTVGWSNKTLGDRVNTVAVYSSGPNANSPIIAKGAYTATLNAPSGIPFTAIGSMATSSAAIRNFQLRYIRTDGTYKDSFTRYN